MDDVVDFAVLFPVRVEGIVVIPRGTILTGKVVSVRHPGRLKIRGGEVKIAYEGLILTTGESATVRLMSKHPKVAKNVAKATEELPLVAAGVLLTGGVPLLALPFEKGDQQVIPAGTGAVVLLNGPLRVSRKAAVERQAGPGSTVYVSVDDSSEESHGPDLFCGQRLLGSFTNHLLFELELNPGTYWFSTSRKKDRPAKIDVLENHDYYIVRQRHGLFVAKPEAYTDFVSRSRVDEWNFNLTGLTPEEYRSLTAKPVVRGNAAHTQDR